MSTLGFIVVSIIIFIVLYLLVGVGVLFYIRLSLTNKNDIHNTSSDYDEEDDMNSDKSHYAIYYGLGPFIWPILLFTYLSNKK